MDTVTILRSFKFKRKQYQKGAKVRKDSFAEHELKTLKAMKLIAYVEEPKLVDKEGSDVNGKSKSKKR